ncbi:MAG: class I SAM-dependent methyltransferase, partial [Candidatus Zixiibacteriota bacterium]
MTTTEIRNKYENFARWYDPAVWLMEILVVRRLRRKLLRRARGHVLEVAVGTGANLEFYPRGIQLTAIDISPAMLERAQQKAKRLKLEADFHVADIESFAPPGESFDTVVSSMATCTFPDPVAALEAMSG